MESAPIPLGALSPASEKIAERQLLHDAHSPHDTQTAQIGHDELLEPNDSAVYGQTHHTVSTASGREVHWTVLPPSQVSCGPVLPQSQVSYGPVLPQSQQTGGGGSAPVLPLGTSGTMRGGGAQPYVQYSPAPPGLTLYRGDVHAGLGRSSGLPAGLGRPAAPRRPADLVGYPVHSGAYQPPAGLSDGGSCLMRGAVSGDQPGSAQHWTAGEFRLKLEQRRFETLVNKLSLTT